MGAGFLAFIAIAISASFTGSAPLPESVVSATAAQKVERPQFKYKHFPTPALPSVVSRVEEATTIIAAPVPRPRAEAPTPPLLVPEPVVESAVAVCLGKTVGSICFLHEKEGTCITPSWQPLTCVPH